MKTITRVALLTTLTLALSAPANAQGRPDGPKGRPPRDGRASAEAPTPGARAAHHLTAAYAKVAPFDANHDGQLNETEREALTEAIADGALKRPGRRMPPQGANPKQETILGRITEMYAVVAALDANRDGTLNREEQAALQEAIVKGEITRPGFGPRGERPDADGQRRGPRGPRPERRGEPRD